MKRYKSAEEFIGDMDQWSEELTRLREVILNTGLKEEIKWGFPCYTWKGKNIVGLGSFKSYFGIWFFHGALLDDKSGKLINAQEGKTHAMRQWRMQDANEIEEKLITLYIEEAIENQKAGRTIKPVRKKKTVSIPEELKNALDKSLALSRAYKALTPFKQREYAEYVGSAKRPATRISRLEKVIPMIQAGKGLNDKYR